MSQELAALRAVAQAARLLQATVQKEFDAEPVNSIDPVYLRAAELFAALDAIAVAAYADASANYHAARIVRNDARALALQNAIIQNAVFDAALDAMHSARENLTAQESNQ